MTDTATAEGSDREARTYNGLFGAFPYAFRASDSRLFRSYVVAGGLIALLIGVVFVLGLVTLLGGTIGAGAGVFTFSRSFYIVVGLAMAAPVIAPVLFVARRHRRVGDDPRYDFALAAMGYLFVCSLYVLLVITTPETLQNDPSTYGLLAPVVSFLYGLPRLAGLVPPLVVATAMYLLHRALR